MSGLYISHYVRSSISHHTNPTTHCIRSTLHYTTLHCMALYHNIALHHITLCWTARHHITFHYIADSGHFTMRDAHDDDSDDDSMLHPSKRNRQTMRGSYRMNSANESQVNTTTFTGIEGRGQGKKEQRVTIHEHWSGKVIVRWRRWRVKALAINLSKIITYLQS